LPQSAIVDSQGFAARAKATLTNSLQNLFVFQSCRRAESISARQLCATGRRIPHAEFRLGRGRLSGNAGSVFSSNCFRRVARIKGEIPNARRSDDAVHRNLFRRGVSLRQGVPEVEVAHAHELDLGNRTYPLHSLDDLSHYRIAVPGEILKCPQTAGCNSPSTL
jgi:hypothetical protein